MQAGLSLSGVGGAGQSGTGGRLARHASGIAAATWRCGMYGSCCWCGCTAAGDSGAAQLATASLRCTDAWLRLSQVAGGGSILTPGEIHAQQVGRPAALAVLVLEDMHVMGSFLVEGQPESFSFLPCYKEQEIGIADGLSLAVKNLN